MKDTKNERASIRSRFYEFASLEREQVSFGNYSNSLLCEESVYLVLSQFTGPGKILTSFREPELKIYLQLLKKKRHHFFLRSRDAIFPVIDFDVDEFSITVQRAFVILSIKLLIVI